MQLIFAIFRSSLQQDILKLLERERFGAFTLLPDVLGAGAAGHALNAFPWPASNSLLFLAVDENEAARLVAALESFCNNARRNQHGAEIPLRVFSAPCRQEL
jgi:hypothetical protein